MHHGQEIFLFFNRFGYKGFFGIIISGIITSIIIYKTLSIVTENNVEEYKQFLQKIVGKNEFINKAIITIVNSFLLIGFYVMIAGFGAYFSQEFNISTYFGAALGAFLCFTIFNKSINGIVKVNDILVPIIIILIIALGIAKLNIQNIYIGENTPNTTKALLYSTTYASYNSITLIPMLISLKNYIKNKKDITKISFLCGIILSFLGIIIFLLLNTTQLNNIEIPMVYIASKVGKAFKYLYGIAILIAILTSAIAEGYSFLRNTTKNKKEYRAMNIFICISSVFISRIGFSKLVNILYPLFGYLSLIQVFLIFLFRPCKRNNLLI